MASKQDIWMPLYIADYLADTTRLSTEQHGAYLLLIMDYWRNGAPPDDDATLANITKLDVKTWRKHRPLLQKLFTLQDGDWHHKRIDEELLKASENAERYASRAKKAAEKRWNKDASSNASSIPSSNDEAMPEDMLADATSPSPSSNTVITTIHTDTTIPSVTTIASVCIAIREVYDLYNKPPIDISQSNPTLELLVKAGATDDEFADSAHAAMQQTPHKGFAWILGRVKNLRKEAANIGPLHQGPMPAQSKPKTVHDTRAETAQAMFGVNHHARTIDAEYTTASDRPLISANG